MDYGKCHVGQHRQLISMDEAEALKEAGFVPGITPDLHAPEIVLPGNAQQTNLHGDIDGSPYSANPGEISLAEAAEKAKGEADPSGDMVDTRAREIESRVTGVDTETLAAEDEAEGEKSSKPKSSSARKK